MFDHDWDEIKESLRSKHARRMCGGSWEMKMERDTATLKTDSCAEDRQRHKDGCRDRDRARHVYRLVRKQMRENKQKVREIKRGRDRDINMRKIQKKESNEYR